MFFETKTKLVQTGAHAHQDAIVCNFPAKVNGYPTAIVHMAAGEVTVLGACHMKPHSNDQKVEIDFKGGFVLHFNARAEAVNPDSNVLKITRIGELERKVLEGVIFAVQMRSAREIKRDLTDSVIRISAQGDVREMPLH